MLDVLTVLHSQNDLMTPYLKGQCLQHLSDDALTWRGYVAMKQKSRAYEQQTLLVVQVGVERYFDCVGIEDLFLHHDRSEMFPVDGTDW